MTTQQMRELLEQDARALEHGARLLIAEWLRHRLEITAEGVRDHLCVLRWLATGETTEPMSTKDLDAIEARARAERGGGSGKLDRLAARMATLALE